MDISDEERAKVEANQRKLETDYKHKVTAEVKLVHPGEIDALLGGIINFRKLSDTSVNRYCQEVYGGRWTLGPAIYVDENNQIQNGQHRLEMVKKTGIPVAFVFVRGLPPNCALAFDNGKNRTSGQILDFEQRTGAIDAALFSDANMAKMAAVVKSIHAGLNYSDTLNISHAKLPELVKKYASAIQFCREVFFDKIIDPASGKVIKEAKGMQRASMVSAFGRAYICYEKKPEVIAKLREYGRKLRTGTDLSSTSPMDMMFKDLQYALTKSLEGGGSKICTKTYSKTATALKALISNQPVKTLQNNIHDPFDISKHITISI